MKLCMEMNVRIKYVLFKFAEISYGGDFALFFLE